MLGAARWVAWDELWFALGTRTWGSQLDFCTAFLLSGKTTDTWIFPWGSACKSPCSCPWAKRKEAGVQDSCSWSKELCCLILWSSCLPPLPLSAWLRCTWLHSQSKFFPAQQSLRTLPQTSHLVLFMQGELSHHKSYVSLFGVNTEKDCS